MTMTMMVIMMVMTLMNKMLQTHHRCTIADALLLRCKTTKPRKICSVPKIDQILEIWKGRIICRW